VAQRKTCLWTAVDGSLGSAFTELRRLLEIDLRNLEIPMSASSPLRVLIRLLLGWSGVVFVAAGVTATAAGDEMVTESRDVSGFRGVEIAGSGRVNISRGASEGLTIEASQETLDRIITEVEDGVLKIYHRKGTWNVRGPIKISLKYIELSSLNLSGSADVGTDWIVAERFDLAIRGSSDVEVAGFELDELSVTVSGSGDLAVNELSGKTVEVRVSGSGDVTARGAVQNLSVTVRGSGNVELLELESQIASARVTGSGDVDIWTTGELDATISGSGDITFRGQPEITKRISGSGRLRSD